MQMYEALLATGLITGGISLISSGIQLIGKTKGLASIIGTVSKGPLTLSSKGRIESNKKLYEGVVSSKFTADETNPTVHTKLFEIVLEGFMKEFTTQDEPVAVTAPAQPVSN